MNDKAAMYKRSRHTLLTSGWIISRFALPKLIVKRFKEGKGGKVLGGSVVGTRGKGGEGEGGW